MNDKKNQNNTFKRKKNDNKKGKIKRFFVNIFQKLENDGRACKSEYELERLHRKGIRKSIKAESNEIQDLRRKKHMNRQWENLEKQGKAMNKGSLVRRKKIEYEIDRVHRKGIRKSMEIESNEIQELRGKKHMNRQWSGKAMNRESLVRKKKNKYAKNNLHPHRLAISQGEHSARSEGDFTHGMSNCFTL